MARGGVGGEVDVAYASPDEFGQIALAWLTGGIQALAGDVSDEILAGPALKPYLRTGHFDEDDSPPVAGQPDLWGDLSIIYPPYNKYYAKPYSRTSLKRLDALAPTMRRATIWLRKKSGSVERGCRLSVIKQGADSGFAQLMVWFWPDEVGDFSASGPEAGFMRQFAGQHAPVFGHVSPDEGGLDGKTQLEMSLIQRPWDTLPQWRQFLRGYSWVTVVPAVIASRVGGSAGLRASGAFTVVDELPGGPVWLQATGHWSEYASDQAAIDRVFAALAPVLPPGRPRASTSGVRALPGGELEVIPFVLSPRDAAVFGVGH